MTRAKMKLNRPPLLRSEWLARDAFWVPCLVALALLLTASAWQNTLVRVPDRSGPTLLFPAFALSAGGLRALSALFHGGAAAFVYLLFKTLRTRFMGSEARPGLAAVGALLFLAMPLQMATAIYGFGLPDIAAAFFSLASVWCFVRRSERRPADLAVSGGLFALALLCRQSALATPALLALWIYCFESPPRWKDLLGSLGVAAVYLLARLVFWWPWGRFEDTPTVGWGTYVFAQPFVMLKYFRFAILPAGLSFDHALDATAIPLSLKLGALAFVVGVSVWLARQVARKGTSAERVGLFGWGWFVLSLLASGSLLTSGALVDERRAYLAIFGPLVLLFLAYDRAGGFGFIARRPAAVWAAILVSVQFVLYAGVGVARNRYFRTEEMAWRSVLEVYPASARATRSLAAALVERREYREAIDLYQKLVERDPADAEALTNLGMIYSDATPFRDDARALEFFARAIKANPRVAEAYYNVGRIYQEGRRYDEAAPMYLQALRLKPEHVPSFNNLASLYLLKGDYKQSRTLLVRALSLDPNYAPAVANLKYLESLEQKPRPMPTAKKAPAKRAEPSRRREASKKTTKPAAKPAAKAKKSAKPKKPRRHR